MAPKLLQPWDARLTAIWATLLPCHAQCLLTNSWSPVTWSPLPMQLYFFLIIHSFIYLSTHPFIWHLPHTSQGHGMCPTGMYKPWMRCLEFRYLDLTMCDPKKRQNESNGTGFRGQEGKECLTLKASEDWGKGYWRMSAEKQMKGIQALVWVCMAGSESRWTDQGGCSGCRVGSWKLCKVPRLDRSWGQAEQSLDAMFGSMCYAWEDAESFWARQHCFSIDGVLLLSACPDSTYSLRLSSGVSSSRNLSWVTQPKISHLSAPGPFTLLAIFVVTRQFHAILPFFHESILSLLRDKTNFMTESYSWVQSHLHGCKGVYYVRLQVRVEQG